MAHRPATLYLASQSPRRARLLETLGIAFRRIRFRGGQRLDAATDESPFPAEAPQAYALRIAEAKAAHGAWVAQRRAHPALPVLAADTTLDLDGQVIGKVADEKEARAVLTRLSGRSHRVITAVCLAVDDRIESTLSVSQVTFRTLDDAEITHYLASGEYLDKAGAYGIQGYAGAFVSTITGSHSGIVGLPLCETTLLLRRCGIAV